MTAKNKIENWIEEYHFEFFKFVFLMTRDKNITDDILQETYSRALMKLSFFNPQKGSFKNWLYRIAINLTQDWKRYNRKEQDYLRKYFYKNTYENEHEESENICLKFFLHDTNNNFILFEKEFEIQNHREYNWKIILKALNSVSTPKQAVILLSIEHDIKEISEILNIAEGTVKSRLFNARKELKELYLKFKED